MFFLVSSLTLCNRFEVVVDDLAMLTPDDKCLLFSSKTEFGNYTLRGMCWFISYNDTLCMIQKTIPWSIVFSWDHVKGNLKIENSKQCSTLKGTGLKSLTHASPWGELMRYEYCLEFFCLCYLCLAYKLFLNK